MDRRVLDSIPYNIALVPLTALIDLMLSGFKVIRFLF